MTPLSTVSAVLPLAYAALSACAITRNAEPSPHTEVWVRSHNASAVDVYLLCGDRGATWLGVVPEKGGTAFEIPPARTHCIRGFNFFLVVRDQGRGYWVGPIRPGSGAQVELVIEKYAGLSAAHVRR